MNKIYNGHNKHSPTGSRAGFTDSQCNKDFSIAHVELQNQRQRFNIQENSHSLQGNLNSCVKISWEE